MGYYKNLLILAEEGNRSAILQVAEWYRDRYMFKQAITWYKQINHTTEIKILNNLIAAESSYGEEDAIFN